MIARHSADGMRRHVRGRSTARSSLLAGLGVATALGLLWATPALGVPMPAQPSSAAMDDDANGTITSLIVAYEPGTAPIDGSGNVSGSGSVPDAELTAGTSLGFGLRTVGLDEPTGVSEAQELANQLESSPQVAWAEPNLPVSALTDQPAPSWGLDRIDQRSGNRDGMYSYDSSGAGVTAYIVDTGIKSTHTDFTGRVRSGFTAISDGNGTEDCAGHGTHVAGTVAGTTYGVAKSATLVPVRVLPCSGSGWMSDVILGLNWAVADHQAGTPAVLNMSLGGGFTQSVNDAVAAAVADGITVVVASGNSHADACSYSPASAPSAITVNASDSDDEYADFSNYGSCTDLYAPGVSITSDYYTGTNATATMSGTSMASPHVAGVAARMLGVNRSWTPAQVWSAMSTAATSLDVGRGGSDPDKLLYVNPMLSATVPAAPGGVTTDARDTSVRVTWTAPVSDGGRTITAYTAKAWSAAVGGTSAGTCQPSPSNGLTCTIGGLTNGTTYYVSVVATNAIGDGAASTRASAMPAVSVPTSPRSVTATAGDASAVMQWMAPVSTGGRDLSGYTARAWSQASGGTREGTCQPSPATATTCTITGLSNATTYYVDAISTTTFGDSTPSARTAVTPVLPAPLAPPAPPAAGGGGSGSSSSPSGSGGSSAGGGGGGADAEVTEVRPAFGPVTGGTRILVLGFGFWGAHAVTIGGVPATEFRYIDAATLEVVTPPGVVGWQPVVVTLAVGRATATFNYQDIPAAGAQPPVASPSVPSPAPLTSAPSAPSAPPRILRTTAGHGSIAVSWSNTSRSDTTRQIVTVYAKGKAVKTLNVATHASRAVVRGLAPHQVYVVRVTAVLSNGDRSTSRFSTRLAV